jgi:hypothetical protein
MLPQEEETCPSDRSLHHCPLPTLSPSVPSTTDSCQTVQHSTAPPDVPVHDPCLPRVCPRSPSAYIFRPLPPALVSLSQEVLSVPRQTLKQPAGTTEPPPPSVLPLYLPHPPSRHSDREANRASEAQQQPAPTPPPLLMTNTPNRHNTESPALSYLEPTIVHGS